ncbi:Nucleotide exchange factor SIL1 [Nakaseomyces bracarensis]|uniref:Nucleotide exchange factor SIL1 n=1 Tax=Nakaseomyces bracarensis TaxID=273131 RepID=A0ABR4NZA1_9SACH
MNLRKSRVLIVLIALLVMCVRASNEDSGRRTLKPRIGDENALVAKPMPPLGPVGGEIAGIAAGVNHQGNVGESRENAEGAEDEQSVNDNANIDMQWMEDHIEDSHDYKKGYGIVERYFDELNAHNNINSPLEARELSSRLVLGCLRNNPPVKRLIWEKHPLFVSQILDVYLKDLLKQQDSKLKFPLMKRYLSILIELINYTNGFKFVNDYRNTLDEIYKTNNVPSDIQIKILELVSLTTSNLKEAPVWIERIVSILNNSDVHLDELHKRFFFNALHKLKEEDKKVDIPKGFLHWLANESQQRSFNLQGIEDNDDKLAVRDLEQEEFDKKLIDSRHLLFGNPLAARIKNNDYLDEL